MAPTKILVLNDIGSEGGAEKILTMFSRALDKNRFELHYLFGSSGTIANDLARETDYVDIINVPFFFRRNIFLPFDRLFRLFYLWKSIINFPGKYVITNTVFMQIFSSPLVKILGKKLIWYEHNIQPVGWRRNFIRMYAKVFPSHIVAVSSAVKDVYSGLAIEENTHVVHNGIYSLMPTDESKSQFFRREYNICDKDFIIVAISRLTYYKGLHLLIDAVNKRIDDHVRLFIIGDTGSSKRDNKYKQLLFDMSCENVVFLGRMSGDDVAVWLEITDVFCAPAVGPDPFPTTILEAMSNGAFCAVSDMGGQPEAISHMKTGIIFNSGSTESISLMIDYVRSMDSEFINRIKRSARHEFSTKFTFESYKIRINDLFRGIISD